MYDTWFWPYTAETGSQEEVALKTEIYVYKRYLKARGCLNKVLWNSVFAKSESGGAFCVTHSLMELSPSWEAANCAATRELPSILWNPEVHHRIHISPPPVPILGQIDPIHTISSYFSKIHFNIVHPSTSWSSQWSLSFWLSHQYPICILCRVYNY
jgi:hypothetical protein